MTKLEVGQILRCAAVEEWEAWLSENHATEKEVWLRFARKGRDVETVKRAEALDVALCYGWIDGQSQSVDADYWVEHAARKPMVRSSVALRPMIHLSYDGSSERDNDWLPSRCDGVCSGARDDPYGLMEGLHTGASWSG